MKKLVDRYILKHQKWQVELETLREILLKADLVEEIKWGAQVYTINGKNVVGLASFKSYVGLWFFQGALLKDKEKVLVNAQEGKTKAMRQLRFNSIAEINHLLISKYVAEAIENNKKGRAIKSDKFKAAVLPNELLAILKSAKELKNAFEKLTAYKQKEYAEYIAEAKRDATKKTRLAKIKPMIIAGFGLNDRHR